LLSTSNYDHLPPKSVCSESTSRGIHPSIFLLMLLLLLLSMVCIFVDTLSHHRYHCAPSPNFYSIPNRRSTIVCVSFFFGKKFNFFLFRRLLTGDGDGCFRYDLLSPACSYIVHGLPRSKVVALIQCSFSRLLGRIGAVGEYEK
jgi:hypothetical protein